MRAPLLIVLGLLHFAVVLASAEDARSKGLVKERITVKQIIANAPQADESTKNVKHFQGTTLAYVTPWNGAGYEAAKTFAAKFTYISPVWYRLERPSHAEPLALVGQHDVDAKWMAAVRASAERAPLIVPRLYVEPSEKVTDMEWMVVVTAILQECAMHKFDGIVLDVGFAAVRAFQENKLGFLLHMSSELHSRNLRIILSVPPYANMFSSANFMVLAADVDAFSLMTYDHRPTSDLGGPVSPHWWAMQSVLTLLPPDMRSSSLRGKILLGANMYGYEYQPAGSQRALTGNDYLRILEASRATAKFDWDQEAKEHRLVVRKKDGSQMAVWYPTLLSLSERMELANELGVGLSLWEIGQALPYFFDLL